MVERQHFHSKPAQDLRSDTANLSGAENPGCLGVKIKTDEPIKREVQVAHPIARPRNLTVEREK